ncbi:MAG TPA: hypothetical protein VHX62_08890 [Solirubrobacteraceae bacterium]|nr:hypothetical protein [Solirubrobacteraceae bacterium]
MRQPVAVAEDIRATATHRTDCMMKVPKQEVLAVLARVGRQDLIEEAKRNLPDPVDTDRDLDRERLVRYGLTRDQLIDRMGGSP